MTTDKVAEKLLETYNKLNKLENIGFEIHLSKIYGKDVVFINPYITVNFTDKTSTRYLDIICRANSVITKIGYKDVVINSSREYATIMAHMTFKML